MSQQEEIEMVEVIFVDVTEIWIGSMDVSTLMDRLELLIQIVRLSELFRSSTIGPQGLTEAQIDTLTREKYDNTSASEQCQICMDYYEAQ